MPTPTAVRFRVALVVATVLAAFSTFMSYQLVAGEKGPPYAELAALNGFYWYAWALMAPPIVWLAQRFRFERHRWRGALAVHVLGALVFAETHIVAQELFRRALASAAGRSMTASFWWGVRRSMIQYLDWEMMTYWAIVGMTFAFAYQREALDRSMAAAKLETKLVETQLQTLQSQLHPHFLFNTLHAISSLMHSNVQEAERMLSRLGELLRMTLDNVGQQEVPLKEELDFLERYLQIEQTRFRDRLTITFDVQPETLDALVPWMLLQPLVENAIKHGISPRPGPGTVHIRSRGSEGRLLLEVVDDGMGLSQDALTALQSGIGLSTTRQRLNHLFRNDYQFEFHRRPRGLTVRVVIPWRTHAAQAAARTA
ncbi:MAG TPA: histidine kinase [Vicinamibacterales bacterium]|nr:histidine kinase [Vicinamibacterales bacterium]